MEQFADNLARLMGLHRVSAKELGDWLDISQSAFSKWASGERQPSFQTALTIGDFFKVRADSLARSPFEDVLTGELQSVKRYQDVEQAIRAKRNPLGVARQTQKRPKVTPIKKGGKAQ
jgi:transcriptional regulator with XRE-family HTH domain